MYPSKKQLLPSTGWAGCLQSCCNYIFLQSLQYQQKLHSCFRSRFLPYSNLFRFRPRQMFCPALNDQEIHRNAAHCYQRECTDDLYR